MCEAKTAELPRRVNTFGPATRVRPSQSDPSKLPALSGGIGGHDAHALPGRCLPAMFLLSTMSETEEQHVRSLICVTCCSRVVCGLAVAPGTYNNTVSQ